MEEVNDFNFSKLKSKLIKSKLAITITRKILYLSILRSSLKFTWTFMYKSEIKVRPWKFFYKIKTRLLQKLVLGKGAKNDRPCYRAAKMTLRLRCGNATSYSACLDNGQIGLYLMYWLKSQFRMAEFSFAHTLLTVCSFHKASYCKGCVYCKIISDMILNSLFYL